MQNIKYYKVADVLFSVTADDGDFALMTNYEPFVCDDGSSASAVFQLSVKEGDTVAYTEEMRQDDEGQMIVCGKTGDGNPVFEFIWANETAGWLLGSQDYRQATLVVTGRYRKLAIDNALMILYALSTAELGVALFHSSTVSFGDKAYMFLGVSGTGKSTHSSLWLKYIEGTELLNDDNPVVRLFPGDVLVYGSPWSGKTHCYKPVSAPLRGLVRLRQAPFNSIGRLEDVDAYLAISSSVSAFHLEGMRDLLHESVSSLVQRIPVYRLDCLPNAEAAQLCHEFFLVSLANIHPEELWPRST